MKIDVVVSVAPFLNVWFNEEASIYVADSDKILAVHNHPKINLGLKVGEPLSKYSDTIMYRALKANKQVIASVTTAKSHFGIPYVTVATPIVDDNNLEGVIAVTMSSDRYTKLLELGKDIMSAVQDISSSTKNLSTVSEELVGTTKNMETGVSSMIRDMQLIENVTTEMKNISNKTNVLGINASIEAARAGEQGRGFAVVANEVRKLAETSKSSAIGIQDSLNVIQVMLNDILNDVKQISGVTDAQAVGITELAQALDTIATKASDLVSLGTTEKAEL